MYYFNYFPAKIGWTDLTTKKVCKTN